MPISPRPTISMPSSASSSASVMPRSITPERGRAGHRGAYRGSAVPRAPSTISDRTPATGGLSITPASTTTSLASGLAREDADRRAAAREVREHLGGDFLRIGAHALYSHPWSAAATTIAGVRGRPGTPPRIAASRTASSSSRPRLPGGFVFASSRRAVSAAAASSGCRVEASVARGSPRVASGRHLLEREPRPATTKNDRDAAAANEPFTRPSTSRRSARARSPARCRARPRC